MKYKPIFTIILLIIDETSGCHSQIKCLSEDERYGSDLKMAMKNCYKDNGTRINYFLYTPTRVLKLTSTNIVDNKKPIKIILPGLGANGNTDVIKMIKDAYLYVHGFNYIVIIPDYVFYIPLKKYAHAYCNVPSIAISISRFLHNLVVGSNVDPANIHMIGSSLGAHIAGVSSSNFQQFYNKTIGRVTGIDPVSAGFMCPSYPECRLDSSDATFVDVIYTNMGLTATPLRSGHVDFLVNDGIIQRGCMRLDMETCSHLRSNYIFNESIVLNSFLAKSCTIFNKISDPECTDVDTVYVGEYCRQKPKYSSYVVYTDGQSPYGLGPNGPIF